MRESDVSGKVMVSLRGDPNIVAFKITDRYTSGIPDISATGYGNTTWLETKHLTKGWTLWRFIKAERKGLLQLQTCRRLAKSGRCWYLVYRNNCVEIWHPEHVFEDFRNEKERATRLIEEEPKPVRLCNWLLDGPIRFNQNIYSIANYIVQM